MVAAWWGSDSGVPGSRARARAGAARLTRIPGAVDATDIAASAPRARCARGPPLGGAGRPRGRPRRETMGGRLTPSPLLSPFLQAPSSTLPRPSSSPRWVRGVGRRAGGRSTASLPPRATPAFFFPDPLQRASLVAVQGAVPTLDALVDADVKVGGRGGGGAGEGLAAPRAVATGGGSAPPPRAADPSPSLPRPAAPRPRTRPPATCTASRRPSRSWPTCWRGWRGRGARRAPRPPRCAPPPVTRTPPP